VTLFAHGARRPKSPFRAVLRPFMPLLVSWSGRSDGGTLTAAESAGPPPALPPATLFAAFYLNELLLRLLPKEDRHETLYDAYGDALAALAGGPAQPALRAFERVLLEELGYGLDLSREAGSRRPLEADRYYHFEPGRGVLAVRDGDSGPHIHAGSAVIAVARGELGGAEAQRAARGIFGAALAHCLEGRGLASREVMLALRRRGHGG
jgi:DNA repair protein RecO (recombination protein O)